MDKILFIAVCLFMAGVGIFSVIDPEKVWEIQHILSTKGGEPTDFYIASTRLRGIIYIIAAAVFIFIILFMY